MAAATNTGVILSPGRWRSSHVLGVLLIALLAVAQGNADEDSERKGLEIALEADRRDSGFSDTSSALTMTLVDASGKSRVREMRQQVLEVEGDGDKSIMVFDRPRDLKGTAILTYTHKVDVDDQWLYLPAIKRVKRISASNKSGPFMGSEFAFEDLVSQEVEKYRYNYLKDEMLGERKCFVVERFPLDKKSGYTRQLAWVDQDEYRTLKIDYYDRKGELLKTLEMKDYQQYLEQFWRSGRMVMTNHQTGKGTTLSYSNYNFKTGLAARDFTRASLAKMR